MPRASWPAYQTLAPLLHAHAGRAAVIVGGGASVLESIDKAPRDAVYFSVNDHGVRYFKHTAPNDGRRCSYVVACDKIEQRARFDAREGGDGSAWNLPVISRHMWADYRILFMPAASSSMAAAYAARLMGCAPIILLGMDLYAGTTYFDAPKAKSSGHQLKPGDHAMKWRKVTTEFPAMYRVIGCHEILQRTMGVYDPAERVCDPAPAETLLADIRPARCKVIKDCEVMMRPFRPGEIIDFAVKEADQLARERRVMRIKP